MKSLVSLLLLTLILVFGVSCTININTTEPTTSSGIPTNEVSIVETTAKNPDVTTAPTTKEPIESSTTAPVESTTTAPIESTTTTPPNDGHTHSFSTWNTTAMPSCTSQGMQSRTCSSCGFSEFAPIAAFGHTEVVDSAVAATCTTDGKTAGKHCGSCNTVIVAQTAIPASGHKYNSGEIITSATCVQDGVKKYTCTNANCLNSYTASYTMPTYTATELYNQSVKYVGEIVTYDRSGAEYALGTGFVITSDGQIVTNYHVLEGAYSATITIDNVQYTIASVLAYDATIDLAVCKINAYGLSTATICKNSVSVGSTVYAIGSSRGMTNTYSQGIITYANRIVDGVSHVQHDASITHGNSGGPLINVYGEVIGINTWGISDSQNLNFAVFTGELDNLTYSTPLTMAQFYDLHHSANDILTEWLLENYNAYTDDFIYYEIVGDYFGYSIAYDITENSNFVDGYWNFEDGATMYVFVDFNSTNGTYRYFASYSDGTNENITRGTINAMNYTASTQLTHSSYSGAYWDEELLMELYSAAVRDIMKWFAYCIDNYIDELTLDDFGLVNLEYRYDSAALTKLNTMLKQIGDYNADDRWYEIEEEYHYSDYSVYCSLVHSPATSNSTASTFAAMGWYGTDGTELFVYLQFYTSGNLGNYYGCRYEYNRNGIRIEENEIEGYLDAATLTPATVLPYHEIEGMVGSVDDLLDVYSSSLKDVLDWVSAVLEAQDASYTIADLGFIFYYG